MVALEYNVASSNNLETQEDVCLRDGNGRF